MMLKQQVRMGLKNYFNKEAIGSTLKSCFEKREEYELQEAGI